MIVQAAAQLLGAHACATEVRLVAAYLHRFSSAQTTRKSLIGPTSLVPGVHSVEFVIDLARFANSTVHEVWSAAAGSGSSPLRFPTADAGGGPAVHVQFRRAADGWVCADGFTGVLAGSLELVASLSPLQCCAIGLPRPGHPYWTRSNLACLEQRYPGLDVGPFVAALKKTNGSVESGKTVQALPPDFMCEARRLDALEGLPWQTQHRGIRAPGEVHSDRWVRPAHSRPGTLPASEAQVRQWREDGWLLIDGVIPSSLLDEARSAAAKLFPADLGLRGEAMAEAGYHSAAGKQYSNASFPFHPRQHGALNAISLQPRLLALLSQLLSVGPDELRLTQSFVTAKFGARPETVNKLEGWDWRFADDHQPMHRDIMTNSLLQPARDARQWAAPEDVQAILYYDDSVCAGGPTAFVPGLRHSDPAEDRLYDRERYPRYSCGTLLLWQLGLWHRGTPVNPGAVRRKHHLSFRTADAEWIGGSAGMGQLSPCSLESRVRSSVSMGHHEEEGGRRSVQEGIGHFLGQLSPSQRAVTGCFPALSSSYWTDARARAAVAQQFEGLVDMSVYYDDAQYKPRL